MRRALGFLLFSGVCIQLQSQLIMPAQSDSLDINNVNIAIHSNLHLYSNYSLPNASFKVPKDSSQSVIKYALIWLAGIDNADDSTIDIAEESGVSGFFSEGPSAISHSNSNYFRYKRLWKISKQVVNRHRALYNSVGYIVPSIIRDWPAHGDVTNGEAFNLAPFIDYNRNGVYDPANGDFPCIKGDQAIYAIINTDSVSSFQGYMKVEIHLMAYAYDKPGDVNNAIFFEYKVINRSSKSYHNLLVGKFSETDLGCPIDDFIGCDTNLNAMFCYNGDNYDSSCSSFAGYGENPGAVGEILLNSPMHSFIYFNRSATAPSFRTDPNAPDQYYNYLNAKWRDGTNLVIGGKGHWTDFGATSTITNFMFPGDPSDSTQWNDANSGFPPDHRRGLISTKFPSFGPGDYIEIDMATVYARDYSKNNIENVDVLKAAMQNVQDFYDSVNTRCTYFATDIPEYSQGHEIQVFPNPASQQINIVSIQQIDAVQLYNNVGALVERRHVGATQFELNVSDLTKGIYVLQVQTGEMVEVRKVVVE